VDHDPAPGQEPGAAGPKQFWSGSLDAFPALTFEVDRMTAAGDHVAMAHWATGSHQATSMGIDPTGKPTKARGLRIPRRDTVGRIVERWGPSDVLDILGDIGAVGV